MDSVNPVYITGVVTSVFEPIRFIDRDYYSRDRALHALTLVCRNRHPHRTEEEDAVVDHDPEAVIAANGEIGTVRAMLETVARLEREIELPATELIAAPGASAINPAALHFPERFRVETETLIPICYSIIPSFSRPPPTRDGIRSMEAIFFDAMVDDYADDITETVAYTVRRVDNEMAEFIARAVTPGVDYGEHTWDDDGESFPVGDQNLYYTRMTKCSLFAPYFFRRSARLILRPVNRAQDEEDLGMMGWLRSKHFVTREFIARNRTDNLFERIVPDTTTNEWPSSGSFNETQQGLVLGDYYAQVGVQLMRFAVTFMLVLTPLILQLAINKIITFPPWVAMRLAALGASPAEHERVNVIMDYMFSVEDFSQVDVYPEPIYRRVMDKIKHTLVVVGKGKEVWKRLARLEMLFFGYVLKYVPWTLLLNNAMKSPAFVKFARGAMDMTNVHKMDVGASVILARREQLLEAVSVHASLLNPKINADVENVFGNAALVVNSESLNEGALTETWSAYVKTLVEALNKSMVDGKMTHMLGALEPLVASEVGTMATVTYMRLFAAVAFAKMKKYAAGRREDGDSLLEAGKKRPIDETGGGKDKDKDTEKKTIAKVIANDKKRPIEEEPNDNNNNNNNKPLPVPKKQNVGPAPAPAPAPVPAPVPAPKKQNVGPAPVPAPAAPLDAAAAAAKQERLAKFKTLLNKTKGRMYYDIRESVGVSFEPFKPEESNYNIPLVDMLERGAVPDPTGIRIGRLHHALSVLDREFVSIEDASIASNLVPLMVDPNLTICKDRASDCLSNLHAGIGAFAMGEFDHGDAPYDAKSGAVNVLNVISNTREYIRKTAIYLIHGGYMNIGWCASDPINVSIIHNLIGPVRSESTLAMRIFTDVLYQSQQFRATGGFNMLGDPENTTTDEKWTKAYTEELRLFRDGEALDVSPIRMFSSHDAKEAVLNFPRPASIWNPLQYEFYLRMALPEMIPCKLGYNFNGKKAYEHAINKLEGGVFLVEAMASDEDFIMSEYTPTLTDLKPVFDKIITEYKIALDTDADTKDALIAYKRFYSTVFRSDNYGGITLLKWYGQWRSALSLLFRAAEKLKEKVGEDAATLRFFIEQWDGKTKGYTIDELTSFYLPVGDYYTQRHVARVVDLVSSTHTPSLNYAIRAPEKIINPFHTQVLVYGRAGHDDVATMKTLERGAKWAITFSHHPVGTIRCPISMMHRLLESAAEFRRPRGRAEKHALEKPVDNAWKSLAESSDDQAAFGIIDKIINADYAKKFSPVLQAEDADEGEQTGYALDVLKRKIHNNPAYGMHLVEIGTLLTRRKSLEIVNITKTYVSAALDGYARNEPYAPINYENEYAVDGKKGQLRGLILKTLVNVSHNLDVDAVYMASATDLKESRPTGMHTKKPRVAVETAKERVMPHLKTLLAFYFFADKFIDDKTSQFHRVATTYEGTAKLVNNFLIKGKAPSGIDDGEQPRYYVDEMLRVCVSNIDPKIINAAIFNPKDVRAFATVGQNVYTAVDALTKTLPYIRPQGLRFMNVDVVAQKLERYYDMFTLNAKLPRREYAGPNDKFGTAIENSLCKPSDVTLVEPFLRMLFENSIALCSYKLPKLAHGPRMILELKFRLQTFLAKNDTQQDVAMHELFFESRGGQSELRFDPGATPITASSESIFFRWGLHMKPIGFQSDREYCTYNIYPNYGYIITAMNMVTSWVPLSTTPRRLVINVPVTDALVEKMLCYFFLILEFYMVPTNEANFYTNADYGGAKTLPEMKSRFAVGNTILDNRYKEFFQKKNSKDASKTIFAISPNDISDDVIAVNPASLIHSIIAAHAISEDIAAEYRATVRSNLVFHTHFNTWQGWANSAQDMHLVAGNRLAFARWGVSIEARDNMPPAPPAERNRRYGLDIHHSQWDGKYFGDKVNKYGWISHFTLFKAHETHQSVFSLANASGPFLFPTISWITTPKKLAAFMYKVGVKRARDLLTTAEFLSNKISMAIDMDGVSGEIAALERKEHATYWVIDPLLVSEPARFPQVTGPFLARCDMQETPVVGNARVFVPRARGSVAVELRYVEMLKAVNITRVRAGAAHALRRSLYADPVIDNRIDYMFANYVMIPRGYELLGTTDQISDFILGEDYFEGEIDAGLEAKYFGDYDVMAAIVVTPSTKASLVNFDVSMQIRLNRQADGKPPVGNAIVLLFHGNVCDFYKYESPVVGLL